MKKLLIIYLLLFQTSFAQNLTDYSLVNSIEKDSLINSEADNDKLKNEESEADEDGMDWAIMQEFERTKDPLLGYPPVERLQVVRDIIDNATVSRAIQGLQWEERGPTNVGGRTRAILVDPNDVTHKKVWAGAASGGLWFNNDITTVVPVWNHKSSFWDNLAISCIASDPDLNTGGNYDLYVGTGEGWFNTDAVRGNGIYKSDNGGITWIQIPFTFNNINFSIVNKIIVNPAHGTTSSDARLFVGTDNGLWQMTNGGVWTKILGIGIGAVSDKVTDIEIAQDASGVDVYASLGWFGNGQLSDGIYKLTSGNPVWGKLNSSLFPTGNTYNRIELATSPSNRFIVYAIFNFNPSLPSTPPLIVKTITGGFSWGLINNPNDNQAGTNFVNGQGYYNLAAAVSPANPDILYVGGLNLYKITSPTQSTQLSSWTGNGYPTVHADQHQIVFGLPNSSDFVVANDGGVVTYSLGNFVDKNTGYNTTQLYSCASFPLSQSGSNKDIFLVGTQDNQTQRFAGLTIPQATQARIGGDGGYCFFDETSTNSGNGVAIGSIYFDNFYKSTNSGSSFSAVPMNSDGTHYPYSGFNCSSKYFISPSEFDSRSKFLFYSDMQAMSGSSPSCNEVPFLSRISEPLSPTLPTPINIALFTPGKGDISHIKVSPYSSGSTTLFVGTYNGYIFKITDAEGSSPTGTDITGDLVSQQMVAPGRVISCIEIGENDEHLLLTYSNYGNVSPYSSIWETHNGGINWLPKGGNLEDMPIRWALFNPNHNQEVLVATEAGVWSTDDINASPVEWGFDPTNGISRVRVDMLKKRKSDNLVLAATHGRGLFTSNIFNHPVAEFSTSCTGSLLINFQDLSNYDHSDVSTQWLWDFGDGTTTSALQNPSHTYASSGSYIVTMTIINTNGIGTISHTINVLIGTSSPVASISTTPATCFGDCNGSAIASVLSGGTAPFTFAWSNGSNNYSLASVCAGNQLSVVITDANGCSGQASVLIGPEQIQVTATTGSPIQCYGGTTTVSVTATGGTTPYMSGIGVQPNISGGYNTFTVTDVNGCVGATTIFILQPNSICIIVSNVVHVTCFGLSNGKFTLAANGGTPGYLFSVNGSPFSNTTSFLNLAAGIYSVLAQDVNGCVSTIPTQITITQPPQLIAAISTPVDLCYNSQLCATSGFSSYNWMPGNLNTACISATSASVYTVTVTNSTGCTASASFDFTAMNMACCTTFTHVGQYDFDSNTSLSGSYSLNSNIVLTHDFTLDACALEIGPGFTIDANQFALTLINGSQLFGCVQMWGGLIVSQPGGIIDVTNSQISDAQFGIKAHNGTTVNVDGSVFTDNYIGIYFSSIGSSGYSSITGSVVNSEFSSTLLKPAYIGQSPGHASHSFCGIYIDKNNFIDIGLGWTGSNIFRDMNFGIYVNNSNVNIENSIFSMILNYDNYSQGGGTAILARGNGGTFINVTGYQNGLLNIYNCKAGIKIWNMSTVCKLNNIFNCDIGIDVSYENHCKATIQQNTINCNIFGIEALMNDYAGSVLIADNIITVGARLAIDLSVPASIGIDIGESRIKNYMRVVRNNEINLEQYADHGIYANGVSGYVFFHNYVYLHNLNNNITGINLTKSENCKVECNNVAGNSQTYTNPAQSSMWFQDSPSNKINCNTITNSYAGITFMGTCLGGTGNVIRGNDIGHHNIGLYYKGTATRVDHQEFRGNHWYLDDYYIYGAWDEDLSYWQVDRLTVDQNGPRFLTITDVVTNHPKSDPDPSITEVFPEDFIFDANQLDESCMSNRIPHGECESEIIEGGGDSDKRSALNLEGSQDFDEETKWKTREKLYEKLLMEPAYLDSDTVFVNFYQAMAGSYLQKIASLNREKQDLYINQESLLQTIEIRAELIYTNSLLLRDCDSTLKVDGLSNFEKDSIKLARQSIEQNINQLIILNDASLALVKTAIESKSDILNGDNALINSPKIYEENEKRINEIYFMVVFKDQFELLNDYSFDIISIAGQCPLSGGPAVYLARTLARIIDPTLRYDDEIACYQTGYSWRTTRPKEGHSFSIFPNPGSGKATIRYSINQNGAIMIYDQIGKLFLNQELSKDDHEIKIDLSILRNGIYSCKLTSGEQFDVLPLIIIQ